MGVEGPEALSKRATKRRQRYITLFIALRTGSSRHSLLDEPYGQYT